MLKGNYYEVGCEFMGGARVQGIVWYWCGLSNCSGGHVMVAFRGFDEGSLGYIRLGELWFVSLSPSSSCLFLINIPTLCLLLVDLGPLPLPRPE